MVPRVLEGEGEGGYGGDLQPGHKLSKERRQKKETILCFKFFCTLLYSTKIKHFTY